jgi:UDP-GlcNAc:undecaprenyl-phosphate GlcNAc-1-phosphate transferase
MFSLAFVTGVSFLLALVLTRLARDGSLRLGLVDLPDNGRKTHRTAVPRTGGVAIVAAYVVTFGLLLYTPLSGGAIVRDGLPVFWKLLPATGAIFLTGLVDDLFHLKAWWKLAGQVAAGGWPMRAGCGLRTLRATRISDG